MAPRSLASYLPAPVIATDPTKPPSPLHALPSTRPKQKPSASSSKPAPKPTKDVVSSLIRASYGADAKDVPDDGLDEFVSNMILREAKMKEEKSRNKVDGYMLYDIGNETSSEAPRLHKRFLNAVIRGVQDHNEELKVKDEERERQKRRAIRKLESERGWNRDINTNSRERHGNIERRSRDYNVVEHSHKRKRDYANDDIDMVKDSRGEKGHDKLRGTHGDREREKRRRHETGSEDEGHPSRHKIRDDDSEYEERRKRKRGRDSEKEQKESRRKGQESPAPRYESGTPTTDDRTRRKKESKERKEKSKEKKPYTAMNSSSTLPSKMDKYFQSSYDPRLDINLDDLTDPTTGFVAEGAYATWDNMLELLKIKKEEKAEKKWLEKMGVSSTHRYPDSSSTKYPKKGEVREWDVGKDMSF